MPGGNWEEPGGTGDWVGLVVGKSGRGTGGATASDRCVVPWSPCWTVGGGVTTFEVDGVDDEVPVLLVSAVPKRALNSRPYCCWAGDCSTFGAGTSRVTVGGGVNLPTFDTASPAPPW